MRFAVLSGYYRQEKRGKVKYPLAGSPAENLGPNKATKKSKMEILKLSKPKKKHDPSF